jgi:6-phosphogluconolactonase
MAAAIEITADADAACARAAELVAEYARSAMAAHGSCTMAVSGGRSPWAMFAHLVGLEVAWDRVLTYQVDERIAPEGDPDRNLTHLVASVPGPAQGGIRPMPVTDPDPEAAAARYARTLPPSFDIVHLGLGPDGHTASLIPGDPVLEVADRDVAVTGTYQGRRRMTLTYPAIDRARRILWLVTGADKVDALARLLAGDTTIPAGRVTQDNATIIADAAAAGR